MFEHDGDSGHKERPQVLAPKAAAIVQSLLQAPHAPELDAILFQTLGAHHPVGTQHRADLSVARAIAAIGSPGRGCPVIIAIAVAASGAVALVV
jgi:hypothetical protein